MLISILKNVSHQTSELSFWATVLMKQVYADVTNHVWYTCDQRFN